MANFLIEFEYDAVGTKSTPHNEEPVKLSVSIKTNAKKEDPSLPKNSTADNKTNSQVKSCKDNKSAIFPAVGAIATDGTVNSEIRHHAFMYPETQGTANRCLHEALSILSTNPSNPYAGKNVGLRVIEKPVAGKILVSSFVSFIITASLGVAVDYLVSTRAGIATGIFAFGSSVALFGVLPMWWKFENSFRLFGLRLEVVCSVVLLLPLFLLLKLSI